VSPPRSRSVDSVLLLPPVGIRPAPMTSSSRPAFIGSNVLSKCHLLFRTALATGFLLVGISLFSFPVWWLGSETFLAARLMEGWTGQHVTVKPSGPVIVLYKGAVSRMAFLVTNDCSVGYLVGALMVPFAPIMMIPRTPRLRVIVAFLAAVTCLVVTNVTRLVGIGASVSSWGPSTGLAIGRIYLGSTVTVVGTSIAGAIFAGVLLVGSRSRAGQEATRVVLAGNGE
jgi:hypothetical protein